MTEVPRGDTCHRAVRLNDLYVRLECWALGNDPLPQTATAWVARLFHDGEPLAELGFVQAHTDAPEMARVTAGLFGKPTSEAVRTVPRIQVVVGALVIVQSQIETPRADHALLVSFAVVRSVLTLRAPLAHYVGDALPLDVADILDASPQPWGGTIHGDYMAETSARLEDLIASSHGGLRLIP